MTRVLIADDDRSIREILAEILDELNIQSEQASTAAQAIDMAISHPSGFDLILLDLHFPDCHDLSTLRELRGRVPATDIIIVTAETDNLSLVREATVCGIYDYVPKPLREDDVRIRVTRALEMRRLAKNNKRIVNELAQGKEFSDIVGQTPIMLQVKKQIQQLCNHDLPVLILGETGTGKELIARALHYGSDRRELPFISINCASIPATLIESELFGHEKGSFTGAIKKQLGAFSRAENGTIFLDEIGDMSQEGQSRLLRVLEQGEYDTVGGETIQNQSRVVLATNQNLERLVEEKLFRKDLYYRIDRLRVAIPPLRERIDDIPFLSAHFLHQLNVKIGKGISTIPPHIIDTFQKYLWPGNIRELRNEIERLYIMSAGSELESMHLSPLVLESPLVNSSEVSLSEISELEQLLMALKSCNGVVNDTAKMLGVHRNTVTRRIKKYGLHGNS